MSQAAPSTATPPPLPRSVFVTILGWSVIIASGFASVISFFSTLMLIVGSYGTSTSDPLGFLTVVVAPPVTLMAGIGLLRRKPWARIYLMALLFAVLASNGYGIFRGPTPQHTTVSASGVPTTTLASPAQYSIPVIALCVGLLVKLFSAGVQSEFGTSVGPGFLSALKRKNWRVGHAGRDFMYYEEKVNGTWQHIDLEGSLVMGRAHHTIYFDSPERWQSYPDWARNRRDEIIARIKSEFREPDYEYQGDGSSPSPAEPQPPALSPTPSAPAAVVGTRPAARPFQDRITPKQLATLAVFIAVFIGLAVGMSWLVADGLGKGETVFPSKHASNRRAVSRQEEPAMFWTAISLYGGIAVLTSFASFWIIREGGKVIVKYRRQSAEGTAPKS